MLSSLFGASKEVKEAPASLFDRYQIDQSKKYGEGGYGATYAAKDVQTGKPLAVKIIDTRRMRGEAIRKECLILERLDHVNVIKVKGHGKGLKGSQQVRTKARRSALRCSAMIRRACMCTRARSFAFVIH